jgi:hypothetical protein
MSWISGPDLVTSIYPLKTRLPKFKFLIHCSQVSCSLTAAAVARAQRSNFRASVSHGTLPFDEQKTAYFFLYSWPSQSQEGYQHYYWITDVRISS